MIFLRKFVMYVSALFLFILSVFSVLLVINKDSNKWIRDILDDVFAVIFKDLTIRIIVLTIATLFLMLCLSVIFSAIKFGRRDRTFGIDSPYGEVKVSIGAIEDYLNVVKSDVKGVKDIRPKVFLRKGKLKIYTRVSLWSDSDISDMVLNVQNAIKSYLEEILGAEKVGDIRVFVSKIVYKEKDYRGKMRGSGYVDKGC